MRKKQKRIYKKIAIHIVLIIGSLVSIIPFIWMILTSFKTMAESIQVPIVFLPQKWALNNYEDVLSVLPFKAFYFNTIVSTIGRVCGQLFICSLAGYSFARLEFFGKKFLFPFILSILMIPSQLYLLPHFIIMQKMGLLDSIGALIIPGVFGVFGTFLMRQFYITIPSELEEAARLDGCNHFQVYWKIFFPLSKPALLSLAVITGLGSWNDLMWPLIVNNSVNKMTLSAGIASMQGQYFTNYPILMAGAVLSSLPIIILFFILQSKIVTGISFAHDMKRGS